MALASETFNTVCPLLKQGTYCEDVVELHNVKAQSHIGDHQGVHAN